MPSHSAVSSQNQLNNAENLSNLLKKLGFGAAPIGNLYTEVPENDALLAIQQAWQNGIRHFDTAPYYGYGLSEQRLGKALKDISRNTYQLSTKVGRCIYSDNSVSNYNDGFIVNGARAEFDYSREGILRSVEASQKNLNTDYIDILLVHDIGALTHGDNHQQQLKLVLDQTLPTLLELKQQGVCGGIGLGVNEEAICLDIIPHFNLDFIMLAGRYTVLEQHNSQKIMALALEKNIRILSAGPYNSGILSQSQAPGNTYNYAAVDSVTLERAKKIYALCAEYNIDVGAVALQFPLLHSAVEKVVAGMRSNKEVESAVTRITTVIPNELWQTLYREGIILNLPEVIK